MGRTFSSTRPVSLGSMLVCARVYLMVDCLRKLNEENCFATKDGQQQTKDIQGPCPLWIRSACWMISAKLRSRNDFTGDVKLLQ